MERLLKNFLNHKFKLALVFFLGILAVWRCSSGGPDFFPGNFAFITEIQGRLLDGNGDPIGGATLYIPCDGNICGNFFSRGLDPNRNANHSTVCRTPPNDGNVLDGNDWFVGTCTDDDGTADDGVDLGEFHGLGCPHGTSDSSVTAKVILPEAGFGEATDSFEFQCSGATGDVMIEATPTPDI